MSQQFDVIIIGAGAGGLMCAATAGYRGRRVLVLDNAKRAGRKIVISGGGKCNFTNQVVEPANFICANPHFVKSALARYRSQDFIELVERHGIDYEERDHGQLFCLDSAQNIVDILLTEADWAGAQVRLRTDILSVESAVGASGYQLNTSQGEFECESLVIASGGLSMPKLGATPFGYRIAEQFGLPICTTSAGLVPFTLHTHDKAVFEPLSGMSLPVEIRAENGVSFKRDLLFTHRGLSGPAALQISNYWQPGEMVTIDLLPGKVLLDELNQLAEAKPNQQIKNHLATLLPKRLVEALLTDNSIYEAKLRQLIPAQLKQLSEQIHRWQIVPNGTEGYRTAEVTLGGVDTDAISSKTFAAKQAPGLYFIGEVLDVTGWLGGYNFQWAWSSGFCCGQAV